MLRHCACRRLGGGGGSSAFSRRRTGWSSTSSSLYHHHHTTVYHRFFASLYAVGEGWTGALGTGRLDQTVRGHFDEEDDADLPVPMEMAIIRITTPGEDQANEEGKLNNKLNIQSVAVGWGHTAVIANKQLYVTGRPHEFSSLLRLRRLPQWLRNYSVRQTLQSTHGETTTEVDPTSMTGRLVTWLSESFQLNQFENWEAAREHSLLTGLTPIALPDEEVPVKVACSAGLTAVVTESGKLFTFGLNGFGQCGIGETSNNVWNPKLVTGLTSEFANRPRAEMEQSHAIHSISLGLQHGLCLNSEGEIFAFGKGDRGQLGQDTLMGESHTALPIKKACELIGDTNNSRNNSIKGVNSKPSFIRLGRILQISSGMLHCAVLTDDNQVLLWGKNILDKSLGDDPKAAAADARLPVALRGLPSHLKILQIASGSHHTAILLEDGSVWGVGISTDTKAPMHDPVTLIPAGVIDLPVSQFAAHMDRTTIVGNDGRQVLQVHLFEDPGLQEYALFTPAWVDRLLLDDPHLRIREVHRSWVHSVAVTS